jgi:hypothetical protein
MPIRVRYQNDTGQECTIRPTPLVSISTNILKDGAGQAFGVTYVITLTGTLLADQGTPYAVDHTLGSLYPFHGSSSLTFAGPYGTFDNNTSHTDSNRPPKQQVPRDQAATSLIQKQKALRGLFAQDGQRIEITDFDFDNPAVICYPRLLSIDFTEGIYVEKCDFTIQLEADTLLNSSLNVDREGTLAALVDPSYLTPISSYDESWTMETDETAGESEYLPRSYRISHRVTATGKRHYFPDPDDDIPPWRHAKKFVQSRLAAGIGSYPNFMQETVPGTVYLGDGAFNLSSAYGGFNHSRSEDINESAGTYGVTENWVVSTSSAFESFTTTVNESSEEKFVSASIEGNIRGLSALAVNQYGFPTTNAYDNALLKYNAVTNNGTFSLTSDVYKRINNQTSVSLNPKPLTTTVTQNVQTGEINYNLSFNNRPKDSDDAGISGVCSSDISVNDTYPGDVFAVIPVLGRQTGPVLQYIGSRTEYSRDLSISLNMCRDDEDTIFDLETSGLNRRNLLLTKPSIKEPCATQLSQLITELSPANEPGIRKYFVSPPSESWNPIAGDYSINLRWTYEMDFGEDLK